MLKRNIIANYVGQGLRAVLGIVFVPLYVRYMGIESYGLVGIFGVLQTWLVLLDLGLKPALNREMARFSAGATTPEWIRDLLRSVEIIGLAIAAIVALGVWACADWLAHEWVNASTLSPATIANAFALMGAVTALRFVENIYVSSLAGLQRQVLENAVTTVFAIVRAFGAIAILEWVSPTIGTFFLWQCAISILTVIVYAITVYALLPPTTRRARFSKPTLSSVWKFAAGMLIATLLSLLLSNVDKMLLSRLLSLEAFGYYTLAGIAASSLGMLTQPAASALTPRFTELATLGDQARLSEVYHQGAQAVSVAAGSAGVVLIAFSERVMMLWTQDAAITESAGPLMSVLVLGSLLNYLMWVPYQLQLAHAWTSLSIKMNVISVVLLTPLLLILVPMYGATAAAWIWVGLNAMYVVVGIQLMHRRLLPTDKWRWYVDDVLTPIGAAAAVALLLRWTVPTSSSRLLELLVMGVIAACVLGAAAISVPSMRAHLLRLVPVRAR